MNFPIATMLHICAGIDFHPAVMMAGPVPTPMKIWPYIPIPSPLLLGCSTKVFACMLPAAPMSAYTMSFHWCIPTGVAPIPEGAPMTSMVTDIPGTALKIAVGVLNALSAVQQMASQGTSSETTLASMVPQAASMFAGFLSALGVEPIEYYHCALGTPMVMIEGAPAGFALFLSAHCCNTLPFSLAPLGFIAGASNVMVGVNIGMALFQFMCNQALGAICGENAADMGAAGDATMMLEPIDMVSGAMVFEQPDFLMLGPLQMGFQRRYVHMLTPLLENEFGPGWTHNLCHSLRINEDNDLFYVNDEHQEVRLPYLKVGEFANVYWRKFLILRVSKTEYHIRTQDRRIFEFDFGWNAPLAKLKRIRDLNDNAIELKYEGGMGKLVELRDSSGRIYRFDYYGNDRLKSVRCVGDDDVDKEIVLVAYEYDEANQLTAAIDNAGKAHTYEYDENGFIKTHTNRNGYSFHYEYDEFARCTKTSGQDGVLYGEMAYFKNARVTNLTDHAGRISQFVYNDHKKVNSIVHPDGSVTETVWNEKGQKVEEKNELMKSVWKLDQEKYRNALEVVVNRVPWTFVYNGGNVVAKIDPYGNKWVREYDRRGNLVFQRSPLGHTWNLRHNKRGQLIHKVDPRGVEYRYEYDERGNMTEFMIENRLIVEREYDFLGFQSGYADAMRRRTAIEHDEGGKLRRIKYWDNSDATFDWDGAGNLVRVTDRVGNSVAFEHGSYNFMRERRDAFGGKTKFDYDESGKLTKLVDGENNETKFSYDDRGRLAKVAYANGYFIEIDRDIVGAVTEIRQPQGKIGIAVNDQGLVEKRTLGEDQVIDYEYNKRGQVIKGKTKDHELLCIYDEEGRLKSEKQDSRVLFYGHDELGNITSIRTNWGPKVKFVYDDRNRPKRVLLGNEKEITFAYDMLGRPVERRYPNGILERVEYIDKENHYIQYLMYDSRRKQWEERETEEQLTIYRRVTFYNEEAFTTKTQDSKDRERMFTYDPSYHLLEVKDTLQGHSESFQYDRAGNMKQHSTHGPMDYGPAGQCNGYGGTFFKYDQHGNLVQRSEELKGLTHYRWDLQNRLTEVVLPSNKRVRFEYGPMGRRVAKHVDGGPSTRYTWMKDRLVMEQTGDNVPITYIYYPGSYIPMLRIVGEKTYFFHNDNMGTPLMLSDEQGHIVWRGELTAFGELTVHKRDVDIPHRFQGQYHDKETDLHYNFNRYYDPKTGRFLSVDPMGHVAGPNLYRYCRNPVNEIDPRGLCGGGIDGMMSGLAEQWGLTQFVGKDLSAGMAPSWAAYWAERGIFPGMDNVPGPFSNGGPKKEWMMTYRPSGGGSEPVLVPLSAVANNGPVPGTGNGTPGGTTSPDDASDSPTAGSGGVEPQGSSSVKDPSPNDNTGGGPGSPDAQNLEGSGNQSWDGKTPSGDPASEKKVEPAANSEKNAVSKESDDGGTYKGTTDSPATEPQPKTVK